MIKGEQRMGMPDDAIQDILDRSKAEVRNDKS